VGGSIWNEELEALTPARLERLESERLSEQMAYVHAASPWYRRLFNEAGVEPRDIRHREDLTRLAFTEKAQLADSQADGALLGVHQCAPLERIVRIQATGGTSRLPMRIGLTRRDVEDYCEMGARALWASGCRPGDVVFECMNYHLYAGGVSDHMTFETVGAATIPYGVGQSARMLEMMRQIDGDVCLWSTPSYAVRLLDVAAEQGVEPLDVGLRKGFFSGEAGMQVPELRQRIEDAWGMVAMDLYGTGELGMHCGECEHRAGVHFGATGFVLVELVDPETAEPVEFADGAIAEFVYTSIRREACPLLRMRSHDLMQVFTEPCACGRTSFRFRVLGRSDDMFIVKGVNVFPLAVQAVLAKLRPRLTGECYVVLDRPPPIDYPVPVTVEVARDVPAALHDRLRREITAGLQKELNFTAAVAFVAPGSIASEKKTRRVVRTYRGEGFR
jgi:phenylacetate-CoA ligase